MDNKNFTSIDNSDLHDFYSKNINSFYKNNYNQKNASFSSTPNNSSQNHIKEDFNSNSGFENIFNNIKSSVSNNNSNNNFYSNIENNNNQNDNQNIFNNIDLGTILKAKSIIDKMNNTKSNPRSNLLYSLKPYLNKNKKEKLEEYIKIFNIAETFKDLNNGGE